MNAKFIRNEHGLRLELVPANDNERVLVAELLSKSRLGYKTKNIRVSGHTNMLTVSRPVYLNKKELSDIGFKIAHVYGTTSVFAAYKKIGNELYVVIGSGEFSLFVINDILDEPLAVSVEFENSDVVREFRLNFDEFTVELTLSGAKKVRTVDEFEELLKN